MRITLILGFVLMVSGMLFGAEFKPEARVNGFVSAGYVRTGDNLDYRKGDFGLQQSKLQVSIKLTPDISAYIAPSIAQPGEDNLDLSIGETYVEVKKIVDIKLGRIDIPFSIMNDRKDANKNNLITLPVGVVLGTDEGVSVGKSYKNLDLVAAIVNGASSYSNENSNAVSGKAALNWTKIGVSVSGLYNGKCRSTTLTLGEADIASASGIDNITGFEAALRLTPFHWLEVVAAYNNVDITYIAAGNDKILNTWIAEAIVDLTKKYSLVARYSLTDCNDGYALGSGSWLGKNSYSYGNSVEQFSRMSLGANYYYNRYLTVKTEVGNDRFNAYRSLADTDNGCNYGIASVVVNF